MALNPKSPLLTPRLNANKIPRRSVGDVTLVNEKLPLDSLLSVGFDNTKRAKSAEFLAVPMSLCAASPANSCETINTAGNDPPEINGGLTSNLEKKLPGGKESPAKPSTPKHSENLMTVEIPRGSNGLGISIIGGSDTLLGAIVVNDIFANGAADKDGRLKVGDILVKVNNSSLEYVTRETAMKLLKQGPSDMVSLVVSRPKEDLMSLEENFETFNVDLNKRPGQNLGLTIIGKHRDSTVCIHELLMGGLAEAEGRLKPGDEILLINKKSFKGQEAAAELLKSAPGMVRLTVRRPWTKKAAAVNAGVPEKVQKRF